MAKQGDTYKAIDPNVKLNHSGLHRFYGKKEFRVTGVRNGKKFEVIDKVGETYTASENVDYPKGTSDKYRNAQYIRDYNWRFEKQPKP
jgi:hypothetical protein